MLPKGTAGSVYFPSEAARSTTECFRFPGADEQPGLQGQNVPATLTLSRRGSGTSRIPQPRTPAAILLTTPLHGEAPGAAEPLPATVRGRTLWCPLLPTVRGWAVGSPCPPR